jgi:hypothetical protein
VELILGGGVALALLIGAAALVVLVALFVVIFVVVPKVVIRSMAPALERRIAAAYSPEQIILKDLAAVTLGLESRGVLQGRGNGALVLTADELTWFRFVPESTDLRIPRQHITKVDTARSHLGKSYGRDLLRVTFTNDGKPDSMAWYVPDLGTWLAKLG